MNHLKEQFKRLSFYTFIVLIVVSCSPVAHKIPVKVYTFDFRPSKYNPYLFYEQLSTSASDMSMEAIFNQADKIEAYNWNENEESAANADRYIMNLYGRINPSARFLTTLEVNQKAQLKSFVLDTVWYRNEIISHCFLPHIAFLYYQGDSIIGQSNVCFMCDGIANIPKSSNTFTAEGKEAFMQFCAELGLTIYTY